MSKDDYIRKYTEELFRVGKSKNTISGYIWNVTAFIKWIEERTGEPFELPITEFDIREHTSYLETVKAASLSSINTRLSAIQNFCDFLHLYYKCPIIKVKKKKGNPLPKVEVLDRNQLYKYRQYIHRNASLLHRTIVETFLNTGIRESELCNLELDDIKATPKNAYIIVRNGKGGKYREIPIVGDYKALLLKYIEQRPDSSSNKVFVGNRGTLTPNGVYKIVHRLGEAKGLKVYPHMLRHQCFTTQAKHVKNAQDLKDMSMIAGHNTVEITMRYYISGSRQNQERLIKEMQFFE